MKAIKDFPGYYTNKRGKVFSKLAWSGELKELPGYLNCKGYLRVALYKAGTKYQFQISRLIALQYIPNPKNYPIVLHKDNNPLNNAKSNLKWGTQSKNIRQAVRDGRHKCNFIPKRGEDNSKSKLSNIERLEIKRLYKTGNYTQKELGKKYKVGQPCIGRTIRKFKISG